MISVRHNPNIPSKLCTIREAPSIGKDSTLVCLSASSYKQDCPGGKTLQRQGNIVKVRQHCPGAKSEKFLTYMSRFNLYVQLAGCKIAGCIFGLCRSLGECVNIRHKTWDFSKHLVQCSCDVSLHVANP